MENMPRTTITPYPLFPKYRGSDIGSYLLVGFIFSLTISTSLTEIMASLLFLNWFLGGNFKNKLNEIVGNKITTKDIPPYLIQAVLATEDRRFYHHPGLDPLGLARAIFVNVRKGRVAQGGSTITQQLAKNLFLSQERTLKRKIQEAMLAFWLEYELTKDEILSAKLSELAEQARRAVSIRFASIDIVQVDGELLVLEINSGVMLEYFTRHFPDLREKAKSIYKKTLKAMFESS